VILTYPDTPVNLANDPTLTNAYQIQLTWQPGAANGGAAILDYRIWYDQGVNSYVIFQNAVTATSFTATTLSMGTTYKF